jgi:hypothetical protein
MLYSFFWDVPQRRVVIPYRRFGTLHPTHLKSSWTSSPLKIRLKLCPETSARNCHSTLRNISKERRSQGRTYWRNGVGSFLNACSHWACQKSFHFEVSFCAVPCFKDLALDLYPEPTTIQSAPSSNARLLITWMLCWVCYQKWDSDFGTWKK